MPTRSSVWNCDELQVGRQRRQVRKQSENFMEGALVGVRRRRERRARIDSDPCDRSTEHLVIRHYVVESGVVSGDRPLANQLSIGVLALSACEKTVPICIGRP